MRRAILVMGAAALMTAAVSTTVLADAVTNCAKLQGKAVGTYYKGLFKETIRACGKGAAMAPLPVSHQVVAAVTGKLIVPVGKGFDKFGMSSCALDIDDATTTTLLSTIQSIVNQACLVP